MNNKNMQSFIQNLSSALDRNIIANSSFWTVILQQLENGEATAVVYFDDIDNKQMVEITDDNGTSSYIVPELNW